MWDLFAYMMSYLFALQGQDSELRPATMKIFLLQVRRVLASHVYLAILLVVTAQSKSGPSFYIYINMNCFTPCFIRTQQQAVVTTKCITRGSEERGEMIQKQ